MKKKKMIPMGQIRSTIEGNVDEENRTIELTFSTGSKGIRNGWDGPYYEELSMDPKHVDMSRLQSGAPLLAAHNSYDLDAVIGVVERAWLEGNEGKAVVRFSSEPEGDKVFRKVKEKVLRNVSIGYQVRRYADVTEKGDKIPTYRAVDYSIMEISIVPIGFDPAAQIRANENQTEVEFEEPASNENSNNETAEASQTITEEVTRMTDAEKKALEQAAAKEAAQLEKTRQTEIRKAVRAAKLEETVADELINNDVALDAARAQILEKLAEQKPVVTSSVRVEAGSDENAEKRREGFEDALLYRIDRRNFQLTEGARQFHGKSLLRQIELIVPRYSMESDAQYAKRAMSSSDLPLALANVAEKSLQKQYGLQPRTFSKWTRRDSLRNYKEHMQVKTGDFGSLLEREEGAEYERASFGEAQEVAKLKDYGIIHAFTSQMLVNDDMSVISRLSSQSGTAVARLENKLAYLALTTNKTMKDGVALYHATHGNLGTPGAISETSFAEAYKLMRKQKSTDGRDPLNLTPRFLVVGPDQEVAARKFLTSIVPNQTSNVNIFQNSVELIVDAEITGNQYYFLADPNLIDTVVCFGLEGQEQPRIESRRSFETDSLELKVAHAFAAAPMDWRGMLKNAGQ